MAGPRPVPVRLCLPGVEEEQEEGRGRLRGGILCALPCAVAYGRTKLVHTFSFELMKINANISLS